MKKKRLIAVIVVITIVVVVIIVASEAGFSTQERLKGAASALFSGGLYETGKSGYIVKQEEQYLFVDKMLADGWVLHGSRNGVYTFEREGHIVEYKEEAFGFDLFAYELTG